MVQSLVTPVGYSSESCGYCKDASSGHRTAKSRASYYILSKCMTVDVYQKLVDRGWRRSGIIFYKPDVLRHCCPHYTIRLPATEFNPAREHRQAINRWNKHILGEAYIKEAAKKYPKSKEEKARQRNGFDLLTTIHEAEHTTLKRPPDPAHKFEVTLEPDDFTDEKYALFANYQEHVHHEPPSKISPDGFKRFLCSSPLVSTTRPLPDGKTQKLGSYHHCYRVDGRLVAMGVLDLLPHCVSGVYLIYHSDCEAWSFGKLSALTEIALTIEGGYQYYYMGYYIHTCAKMRYKGQYKPSHLLDPESYEWNPLDGEVRELLDKKNYVSLARERRLQGIMRMQQKSSKSASDGAGLDADAANASKEEETDEDNLADYLLHSASEAGDAVEEGMSLFDLKVPGLMSPEDAQAGGRLDNQAVQLKGVPFPLKAEDFESWEKGDITDPQSLKGIIGELVACLGPEAAAEVAVNFG